MNIQGLGRTGQHIPDPDGIAVNPAAIRSGLPFTQQPQPHSHLVGSPQSGLSGMSLVSQLTSPPVAGGHAAALQQLHLQSTGVHGEQSLLGTYPKPSPARNLAAQYPRVGVRNTSGHLTHTQQYYYRKWRRLKRLIKDTVFLNASVCDEVVRVEEKLARSKEERRFLLRKLLQYQSLTETPPPVVKQEVTPSQVKSVKAPVVASTVIESAPVEASTPAQSKSKSARKKAPATTGDKKKGSGAKETTDPMQPKPKKSKSAGANRRIAIPPIPLDPTGRPVFPLVMGDLTVHSLGELNPDKSSFHCTESIYPVGFCSTRVYSNIANMEARCVYTCKISDSGGGPVFEIAPDDSPDKVWKCKSPSECHTMLLAAINKSRGLDLTPVSSSTSGIDFFGLTHPVVQNLIQSLPGARKCSGYKWHKYEVNKGEVIENIQHCVTDPVVNYDALRKHVGSPGTQPAVGVPVVTANAHLEPSTSLRSLLTSGPFSTHSQK